MSAVVRKAWADLSGRRLQTSVIALVVALSSLAGALAMSLLVETDKPFDRAFEAVSGAHLSLAFDPAKASTEQVRSTGSVQSVSSYAGPFPEFSAAVSDTQRGTLLVRMEGRDRPDGPVDRLTLRQGSWSAGPGQVVLSTRLAGDLGLGVGDTMTADAGSGLPPLRVVGVAVGVADPAGAWVASSQVPGVLPADAQLQERMFYRLHHSTSNSDVTTAAQTIGAAVPTGAVVDSTSWLDIRRNADIATSVMVPFLLAFSGFALLAAALIIGNVVAGAVLAGYRDIGVLKSVGFTPAQVALVYLAQMLVPGLAGCAIGIPLGVLISQPFIAQTAQAFNLPQTFAVSPEVDAALLAGVLAVVALGALLPALRAGRLSAIEAISSGSSPRASGVSGLTRRLARLPVPRAYSLGAGEAFARPIRSLFTAGAIVIAVATIAFASGLVSSLQLVAVHLIRSDMAPVVLSVAPPGQHPGNGGKTGGAPEPTQQPAADPAQVIPAQPGTAHYLAETSTSAQVGGVVGPATVTAYRGDSRWLGWAVIRGRWYQGQGEAVATTELMRRARATVGDTLTLTIDGHTASVKVVGTYLDQGQDNLKLQLDASTLSGAGVPATLTDYEIGLDPGTNPPSYAEGLVQAMRAAGGDSFGVDVRASSAESTSFVLIESVLVGLALVLTAIGLAGVFNTVLLSTRERARDISILKVYGMTPAQTLAMVLCSVALLGVLGGLLGIPVGIALHHRILATMADIAAQTELPDYFYAVFNPLWLAALVAAGAAVALLGALLPARWAAARKVAAILHAE